MLTYEKDIAELAIQRMQKELDAKQGKVIYSDYKTIINNYLVPSFGKHNIDSIDHTKIAEFTDWRTKRMGKAPMRSTVIACWRRMKIDRATRGRM